MEQTLERPQSQPAQASASAAAPAQDLRMRVLTKDEFEQRWSEIRPLLDPATPYNGGEYDTDDLLVMVKEGHAFGLGFLCDGVCNFIMILQVQHMPRKKVLHILCWGGPGMRRFFQLFLQAFLSLAKRNGCQAIRGAMRPSMERYAKRFIPNLTNLYSIVETSL